ncbi:hypothetical protein HMPREF3293_01212 [Christensenella minuta]|uniref:Uncharacterized protein n=1 Tax=Christensenella minuta TaxID=626937 RepID=A0A136Q5J2_9FIRM|nr:hypothetical protein HMPREF3293_01212 [Christensenella minuta]
MHLKNAPRPVSCGTSGEPAVGISLPHKSAARERDVKAGNMKFVSL